MRLDAALADARDAGGDLRDEFGRERGVRPEGAEVAAVDADHPRARLDRPPDLLGGGRLDERREAERVGEIEKVPQTGVVQHGRDEEADVRPRRARGGDLVLGREEVLVEKRHLDNRAHRPQKRLVPEEAVRLAEDGDCRRAVRRVRPRERDGIEVGADQTLRGRRLLQFGDDVEAGTREGRAHGARRGQRRDPLQERRIGDRPRGRLGVGPAPGAQFLKNVHVHASLRWSPRQAPRVCGRPRPRRATGRRGRGRPQASPPCRPRQSPPPR